VLRSGIPWEMLPRKQFGLSGEEWTRASVWEQLKERLLDELGLCGKVNFSRLHRLLARAGVKKRALTGPSPTDRAKAGSKHHLLVEAHDLPLTESVTAANVHDTHEIFRLVDSMPAGRMPSGQRRFLPGKLHGDKAYASRKNQSGLRLRGIFARIARPGSSPRKGSEAIAGSWSALWFGRTDSARTSLQRTDRRLRRACAGR
jgi:hypothetical protein